MKKVRFGKSEILLVNARGRLYAVNNRCPHMGADLSKGELDGEIIICPSHRSKFDLRDGRVISWTDWSGIKLNLSKVFAPPKPLKTYAVKEDGDKILIYAD